MDRIARRTLLWSGVTGVAALGGCLGDGTPADGASGTPADSTSGTPPSLEVGDSFEFEGGGAVTVAETVATRQILTADDGTNVVASEDDQFLVVSLIGGDSSDVSITDRIRLRIDGERHAPTDHRLASGEGDRRLAIGLPLSVDPADAAICWVDGGEVVATWRIPESERSVLDEPPVFEDLEFAFPTRVASGDLASFDVRVHNSGGPGPFRAVVTTSTDAETEIRRRVDGGTLVGHTGHVGIDASPGTDATATLDWGFDERERSFTVEN